MPGSAKYWMSAQRGLPPPSGRLGRDIGYARAGSVLLRWSEQGGAGALPPPQYLRSRAEAQSELEAAARAQLVVREARAGLAHGPGVASPPPYEVSTAEAPGLYETPTQPLATYPVPSTFGPQAVDKSGVGGVGGVPRRVPFDAVSPEEVAMGASSAAAGSPLDYALQPPYPTRAPAGVAPSGKSAMPASPIQAFGARATAPGLSPAAPVGGAPPGAGVASGYHAAPLGLQPPGTIEFAIPTDTQSFLATRAERQSRGGSDSYAAQEARRTWQQQLAQGYRQL